jgi:signal transduction histidine kinase
MDDRQLPASSRRLVAMIQKSAKRLQRLINEIMEFRKTETQNRRLTVARGDIGQHVREICLNYKELYRNPKVQFVYNIAENLPSVWFDSEIITTILNNYLSNAIKYTEQGSITTTVQAEADRCIRISVADTGYGISPDALPHIFERYYQANGSHQASGTGIGLALVKSLADLHEAQVSVDSHE